MIVTCSRLPVRLTFTGVHASNSPEVSFTPPGVETMPLCTTSTPSGSPGCRRAGSDSDHPSAVSSSTSPSLTPYFSEAAIDTETQRSQVTVVSGSGISWSRGSSRLRPSYQRIEGEASNMLPLVSLPWKLQRAEDVCSDGVTAGAETCAQPFCMRATSAVPPCTRVQRPVTYCA